MSHADKTIFATLVDKRLIICHTFFILNSGYLYINLGGRCSMFTASRQ